jgi:transcriptional regulator
MYVPKHFDETRIEILHELIRRRPLGTLIAVTPQGLQASHVPFELDPAPAPNGTLRCHLARANALWEALVSAPEVLVVFQDVESYISPSWYQAKREHGKVVPTWNYAVVHAYGAAKIVQDAAWLRSFVGSLTDRHEAHRSEPWQVSDAPEDYVEKMLGAIVGVEIPIARMQGSWKLSQNRSAVDREGVAHGLRAENTEMAQRMAGMIEAAKREK